MQEYMWNVFSRFGRKKNGLQEEQHEHGHGKWEGELLNRAHTISKDGN
jgi:hypothetical protein